MPPRKSAHVVAAFVVVVVVVVVVLVDGVSSLVQYAPLSSFTTETKATTRRRNDVCISRAAASFATTNADAATSSSSKRRVFSALRLGPMDDLSDYGRGKQNSELDNLVSKREAIKRAKIANIKPIDDEPRIDDMSDEELRDMLQAKEEERASGVGGRGDDDLSLFAMPEFKTKRSSSNADRRGLSSGNYGGDVVGGGGGPGVNNADGGGGDNDNSTAGDDDDSGPGTVFVDWTADYDDENEIHVPNRIGFTVMEWGDVRRGYVDGKLKKKDRALGRFNKSDLKKAYEKLQRSGVSFVETSESYSPIADALLNEFHSTCNYGDNDIGPLLASTFPNPWKHAIKNRAFLPRRGASSIVTAAESACERLGSSSLGLYQIENPRPFYPGGGSSALAEGMLDVISDDHARYVGCVNFLDVRKLAKLQMKLKAGGEFVATNRFDFSLTNRANLGLIAACKKMGITPLCTNVLDGGLATGRYTSTNPTGGEVSKKEGDLGPYPIRKLDKLDVLFRAQDGLREKVNRRIGDSLMKFNDSVGGGHVPRINRDVTTTQIAINYVRAKGAVPVVSVTSVRMANELLGCLGWELSEEEVDELDKACKSCGV